MENTNNLLEMDEQFEDTLSFCDLPLHQETETNISLYQDQENQDLFDFVLTPNSETVPTLNNIIFCGKVVSHKMEEPGNALYDEGNSPLSSNPTRFRSKSNRSNSLHMQTSKPPPLPRANGSFRCQSGNSRKHKFMIGLARIPPEMVLSDIRKRQSRQAPIPMFPAKGLSDKAPIATSEGGRKGYWGQLRPMKCRSYLAKGLTRASHGCMPLARGLKSGLGN